MGKYDRLSNYLLDLDLNEVSFEFSDLEGILGFRLPDSAREYRPWWANSTIGHSHASFWMDAGWRVVGVDLRKETVRFRKVTAGERIEKRIKQSMHDKDVPNAYITAYEFEKLARRKVSEKFGIVFLERSVPHVHKKFDMVSEDGKHVGDAKFLTMVRGQSIPPAKFSVISEHVWLLENTQVEHKFLVFGNDRRVPEEWLKRYGNLVKTVEFYFFDHERMQLTKLN